MTQTGYANAIINTMLGWLKGLANWVLKLFNLAAEVRRWNGFRSNWLKLLILFMIIGVVTDRVVWLIRWRPYWAWFKKKRIIVKRRAYARGRSARGSRSGECRTDFPGKAMSCAGRRRGVRLPNARRRKRRFRRVPARRGIAAR